MNDKLFYPAGTKCPACLKLFKSLRARTSMLVLKSMDADFCEHYYDGLDPLEQAVIICPQCFFAAEKSFFERLPTLNKDKINETTVKAKDAVGAVDLTGRRDQAQVLLSFQLAQLWAATAKHNFYYRALLHHRLAWYYRKHSEVEKERAELEKAAALYEHAYGNDSSIPKSMGQGVIEYLVGELMRRIGKIDDAARWLSRSREVAGTAMPQRVRRLWEDAWEQVREAKKA